jgi:opacity protein-like surface antigen
MPVCAHAEIFGDKIRPYVSVVGMYDSNVFRVKDGEQLQARFGDTKTSDFISIYSAGVDIVYPVSQQTITVSARKDFVRYATFSDYNVSQDDLRAGLKLRLFDRIVGDLNASYMKVPEPFENFQGFQKALRSTRAAGGSLGYEFPWGLTLKTGARVQKVDYSIQELAGSEYESKSLFGQASYVYSPKTTFDLEFRRTWYDYTRDVTGSPSVNDSTANLLQGGISYAPGAKTRLDLHVGMMKRTYDLAPRRDFTGIVGRLDLKYAVTSKLTFSAFADRSLVEETFLDQTYSDNRSFGTDLMYRVTAKTEIGIGAKFTKKDFQSAGNPGTVPIDSRKDRLREAHAGVGWTPWDKLQVSAMYRHSTRSSNFALFDYKDHTVEFGITYRF